MSASKAGGQKPVEVVDVEVSNEGSVFLFHLNTADAEAWVEENVETEGWQWMGRKAFAVDHRYAQLLAEGMLEAGLVVR